MTCRHSTTPATLLPTSNEPWKPRAYQRKAVSFLVSHPEAGLFLDPGLGKTSIALKAFQSLKRAGSAHKMLVIAPRAACYLVWSREGDTELAKWSTFDDLSVTVLHGPHKEKSLEVDSDLYVINPDGLPWLTDSHRLDVLLKRGIDILCVDELSKFKHPKTRRFKLLKPYLPRFKRRWGLTGSPAPNGLLDLFGQAYVLDLGQALGQYITHYRFRYFLPTGYGGYHWKIKPGAEGEIYARLKPLALSMRATDHLDLPALVEQNLWVNLPPKAQRFYDALEEDLIAAIDNEVVTAANMAVASGKCRQVASGGIYTEGLPPEYAKIAGEATKQRKTIHLHDEKTQALSELVEELQGSPLLVAYEFDHDLERIRKVFKEALVINGQTHPKELVRIVTLWNQGSLPLLLAHPQAVGHGLNLQRHASHVCWYSLTWNFELYDQLNRRIYRQGNKAERVIVHRLLARKTVDEVIARALTMKQRGQDDLLSALRTYRKRG